MKSHGSHTILEELNSLINAKSAIFISFTERGVTNAVSLQLSSYLLFVYS